MNVTRILYVWILALSSQSVLAANMDCEGGIIEDDLIQPATMGQVQEKCGNPDRQEGNVWVYNMENMTYRLQFDSNGNMQSLESRMNQ